MKVINFMTGRSVLVNPEGYNYSRYTGLDIDEKYRIVQKRLFKRDYYKLLENTKKD